MSVSKEALYVYSLRDIQTYNFFFSIVELRIIFLTRSRSV